MEINAKAARGRLEAPYGRFLKDIISLSSSPRAGPGMTSRSTEQPSGKRHSATLLLIALSACLAFRAYLLWANDFPLGDGALFLEFVHATAATFPKLPAQVSYNGLVLPFSYPPLSFWLAALLTKAGFDSLGIIRAVPILMNIGYVSLFALLLLRSGRSYIFVALAILFVGVNLRAVEWLLMGGGLSRGLGSIFFLLALVAATVPEQGRERMLSSRRMLLCGGAVGLAILSHLEWGLLAAGSVVLSRALGSRSIKDFLISSMIAGGTASALVLPWLLFITATHGLQPLLAAGSTSGWSLALLLGRLIWVATTSVEANPLVLIGGFGLLLRRQWFWLGFIVLCELLTPRHGPTPLGLPMAVLGAQGVVEVYRAAARFFDHRKALAGATAGLVAVLVAWGAHRSYNEVGISFAVLPRETREAMAWVAANQPGARFAIINDQVWQNDRTGEWFPTLASAQSVTTVQGREWNGQFLRWQEAHASLRESRSCSEIESNIELFGAAEFVLAETMRECFAGGRYSLAYQNERVGIYKVSR